MPYFIVVYRLDFTILPDLCSGARISKRRFLSRRAAWSTHRSRNIVGVDVLLSVSWDGLGTWRLGERFSVRIRSHGDPTRTAQRQSVWRGMARSWGGNDNIDKIRLLVVFLGNRKKSCHSRRQLPCPTSMIVMLATPWICRRCSRALPRASWTPLARSASTGMRPFTGQVLPRGL